MICSDFGESKYYIPECFEIGFIGFIADDDDLKPVKIVSIISEADDPDAYNCYCGLPEEDRNDFMDADRSCEFVAYQNTSWIVGFDYLTAENVDVSFYC